MEVILLNNLENNVKNLFSRYVPKEFEHYMGDGALLLGALETSGPLFEPVGLTILAADDGQLAIKWMWMDPDNRFKEGGSRMLEKCMNIADENGLEILCAHIPSLEAETIEDSDLADFFYENDFRYSRDADTDDGRVFVLVADVDTAVSLENDEENARIAKEKLDRAYDKFPKRYMVTDVEYYSGVPVE